MLWRKVYQTESAPPFAIEGVQATRLDGARWTPQGPFIALYLPSLADWIKGQIWARLFQSAALDFLILAVASHSELEQLIPSALHQQTFSMDAPIEGLRMTAFAAEGSQIELAYSGLPTEDAWESFETTARTLMQRSGKAS